MDSTLPIFPKRVNLTAECGTVYADGGFAAVSGEDRGGVGEAEADDVVMRCYHCECA